MATIPLFDCLNAINLKNPNYKYDKKDCSGYMLLMWFSHDKQCMPIVNTLNDHLFRLPDEAVYAYLYRHIPKGKKYLKWDKGVKDKDLLKKEQKIIQEMKDEWGFSNREAKMIYNLYIKER